MRRLSGALQADHHVDRRRRVGELQTRFRAAHERDELVVDDLDDRLRGRQRGEDVGADGFFLDRRHELFGNGKVHVGFEKRDANFARDVVDVGFRQRAATSQTLEDRAEPFAESFEHGWSVRLPRLSGPSRRSWTRRRRRS